MRIYLAACYPHAVRMQTYRADIESLGHQVTSRWIDNQHNVDGTGDPVTKGRFAMEDAQDVLSSDCFITFTEVLGQAPSVSGGRHVELGMALVHPNVKRILVIGPRENIFHWIDEQSLPLFNKTPEYFETWEQARIVLYSDELQ
jgi:hypothetical protein